MSQINIEDPNASNRVSTTRDDGARTVATSNLTWAIAVILVIAAIAIAAVWVFHSVVH